MSKELSTGPYKGVRDFYPDDMAVQRYMFGVWEETAESFGFERYEASVLEPAELYKAKGAENEEIVKEQSYTFEDRGGRMVTLRPEMTPTVARMVAARRRELSYPLRWYSIPNLFRYERMQRGRLREHWQLNADIFGVDNLAADVEIIALAYQIFLNFGADEEMFEIRINNRRALNQHFADAGITDQETIKKTMAVIDRKDKMGEEEFTSALAEAAGADFALPAEPPAAVQEVLDALGTLGVGNASYDPSIVRGFDYYTGTVFEIFDTNPENNRAMMGGGRYDDLTAMFGGEKVPGVGFGFGDVTLKHFLEVNGLLTANITSPTVMILPTDPKFNIEGERLAQEFRAAGVSTATDISDKKLGKKMSAASDALVDYVLVLGEDEVSKGEYTLKNMFEELETSGTIEDLIKTIVNQ